MAAHLAERMPSLSLNVFHIQSVPPTVATATQTNRQTCDKSVNRTPQATPTKVKIPPPDKRMYAAVLILEGSLGLGFRACLMSQGTMKNCITRKKPKEYGSNVILISSSRLTIQIPPWRDTPTGGWLSTAIWTLKSHRSIIFCRVTCHPSLSPFHHWLQRGVRRGDQMLPQSKWLDVRLPINQSIALR